MIELLIAALIQIGTITTDPAEVTVPAETETTAAAAPGTGTSTGGTGAWDDNN